MVLLVDVHKMWVWVQATPHYHSSEIASVSTATSRSSIAMNSSGQWTWRTLPAPY